MLSDQHRSRRSVLTAAVGAVLASIAGGLRPPAVRALGDDDANLQIGHTYADARTQTTLANQDNSSTVLYVASNSDLGHGDGVAITGYSAKAYGIEGATAGSTAAVYGHGPSFGVLGAGKTGLLGHSTDAAGQAVWGYNDGGGTGILAVGTTGLLADGSAVGVTAKTAAGTGVYGYVGTASIIPVPPAKTALYGEAAKTGYALHTKGRVQFGQVSGVATIAAGTTAAPVITPGTDVTAASYVLLTPQSDPGTRRFWATLDTTLDKITIHTNATSASAIKIAWLLIR